MLDRRIEGMTPEMLECYASRHVWTYRGARVSRIVVDGRRAEEITQICQRCPKTRVTVLDRRDYSRLRAPRYNRVRGYDAEPGQGRIPRRELVGELVRRAREGDW